MGTQMPSLRPLSTFRLWRIRSGSDGSVTTACPSAASVGARITASSSASDQLRPVSVSMPAASPAASVSGSPIPSSRDGSAYSRPSARRSMREASENSTNVSVASTSSLMSPPSAGASIRPSASAPAASPAAVNTIAAVSEVPASLRETAA